MGNGRDSGEAERKLEGGNTEKQPSPAPPAPEAKSGLHPSLYIILWITLSSSVILFNKWILSTAQFKFPLFLTTWHMLFAAFMTQLLARFTSHLDSRHKVPMTTQKYMQAIVPIGIMFSLSLIFGNVAYMYLSVSFIQMLKASNVVATLLATWIFGLAPPSLKTLGNVTFIVVGVVIASYGEIKFDMVGFVFQACGIIFEATRLTMVQRLLSSAEFKMDPMVSLYYFAPACAVINGVITMIIEVPKMTMGDIHNLGYVTLVANAFVAFLLNVSVVLLIGKTSAVVLTLSGVLKDILLVMASMAIFHDPVSGTQYFGYSIALGGLVYYRLGSQKMQEMATHARLTANNFRQERPVQTRLTVLGILLFVTVLIYLWPRYSCDTPSGDCKLMLGW